MLTQPYNKRQRQGDYLVTSCNQKLIMAVFVAGLIGVVVFYIAILVIGLIAGRKKSRSSDSQFLADRDLGLFVSSFTLSGKFIADQ